MKWLEKNEEGQGNPRVEVAIEPRRAKLLLSLANYYHRLI